MFSVISFQDGRSFGLALSVHPERYLLYKFVSFVEHLLGQHGWIWSSIVILSSPVVTNPMSSSRMCMYMVLSLPLLVCLCCGCDNTKNLLFKVLQKAKKHAKKGIFDCFL